MNKLEELSVFFPLYNEEDNVERLVAEAYKVIPSLAHSFEIILVDDGSTDKTPEICRDLERKHPELRVVSQPNSGYGGAISRGFSEAKFSWIFFSDGDLQFDLNELQDFIPYTNDFDLVIGYRKKRAEGFKRILFAKGMKIWNYIFLGFPLYIRDIDCAFKLIKKEVFDTVGLPNTRGNLVSTEFLLKAIKADFKIKQIGVTHLNRSAGESKCGDTSAILKVIEETFLLRKALSNE